MRRHARKGGGRQVDMEIAGIGGRGDGVGLVDDKPVFVPLTVAGDRVRVKLVAEKAGGFRGEAIDLLEPGPARVEPPCPHFGPCGGCALQHLSEDAYTAWKIELIETALTRQGIEGAAIAPLRRVAVGSRRRAEFSARRQGGRVLLGFHRRFSHAIEDLTTCLIVTPTLRDLLAPLRGLLAGVLADGAAAQVTVTETETGCDLLLSSDEPPDLAARERFVAFAREHDLARLSWRPAGGGDSEPLVELRAPIVRFGGVAVTPPAGGFLQPTVEGEAALVEAVLAAIPATAGRILDLFAGAGTFTFPLAKRASVRAVEGEAASLGALWAAARHAGLAGPVAIEQRDLARQPLLAEALRNADAVVLDPPRQGAREQVEALAESGVGHIVYVSCNPIAFARDARILIEAGYRLGEILPVDQFPWSPHLELVAAFTR